MKSLNDFEEVFHALLSEVIADGKNNNEIDPEQYEVLGRVFKDISALIGSEPKIKLHPSFASGSVTLDVSDIHLNKEDALTLMGILSFCDTFEVLPLNEGKIRASVTVEGVFKTTE